NKKLGLGADVNRIRDTGEPKVAFRTNRDRTRIKPVAFFCDRVDDVRDQADRRFVRERVDPKSARIRDKQHVRFVYRRPTAKARRIKAETVFETVFGKLTDRKCQMVPRTE